MSTDSQIMNYVVRMVVPMRREFGRNVDVRQFLHDVVYAKDVVDQALQSSDERLVEYARYVQEHLLGPRTASPRGGTKPVVPAAAAAAPAVQPTSPVAPADAAQLRAQVMKKYTGGLR